MKKSVRILGRSVPVALIWALVAVLVVAGAWSYLTVSLSGSGLTATGLQDGMVIVKINGITAKTDPDTSMAFVYTAYTANPFEINNATPDDVAEMQIAVENVGNTPFYLESVEQASANPAWSIVETAGTCNYVDLGGTDVFIFDIIFADEATLPPSTALDLGLVVRVSATLPAGCP